MKKILFFGALSVLALSSCRKDDDDNESSIVGTWKITKYETRSGKDNSVIDSESYSGCEASSTYEFKNNNTFYWRLFNDFATSECVLESEENGNYSYNSSNKTLSVKNSDKETYNSDVESISNNQMVLSEGTDDENGDGVADKYLIYYNK